MKEFFIYYVKGRVFEWTMALAMFIAGVELLLFDEVLTFGAFRWLTLLISQKGIGTLMFFIGWLRISSLMFNGQLLFGRQIGRLMRAICAALSSSIWAQFTVALMQVTIEQGVPSLGLPFWFVFTIAELGVAYSVGAEWKK